MANKPFDTFAEAANTPETRAEQPATGVTPRGAEDAASTPTEKTPDEINAEQAAAAKAAGKEYQGQLPPEPRPTVKQLATEKDAPASGADEQA